MLVTTYWPFTSAGSGEEVVLAHRLVHITGMSVGTLFTLFVLPAVYDLVAQPGPPARRAREIALR